MASTFGVRMAHHEEAHVSSHLLCSIPHGTFVEIFHAARDPIWHHLIANRPPIVDGSITLSERPGLGWELDWDYVRSHRVDDAEQPGRRTDHVTASTRASFTS